MNERGIFKMNIKTKNICDYKPGERIDDFLVIKKVDLKTTNQGGKKYLDFILGDSTGEISAKLWELKDEHMDAFAVNMVVKVRGTVILYQNVPQFKVELIREKSEDEDIETSSLVTSAPIEPALMYDTILADYILGMTNDDIRNITETIFTENREFLMYYPAAKRNHHSIRGGLLYHVLTMLKIGESLAAIYPQVNKDLLFSGIILHDMMKIKEMNSSELGIVDEYTVEGTLLGHITQGIKNISKVAERVGADPETAVLIEHMLLSHHYEPEFGSPVRPMFKEAELLHHIDMIDARMYDFTEIESRLKPGTFSEYILSLDRRRVYRTKLSGSGEENQ